MRFYLGTHEIVWLERTAVPLFVSHRRLARKPRKVLPRALGPWALDSGGFSELSLFGVWKTSPEEYARAAQRYAAEIGKLDWAAIQDWMCEPFMLEKTGKTIEEHQHLSVESLLTLRELAPDVPWIPVLQGWELEDYARHADLWESAGIDLAAEPIVGVGSVCRRQHTDEAERLLVSLRGAGAQTHGFGFKIRGLQRVGHALASADSMAWSFNARKHPPLPGCTHSSCANCMIWALRWRERLVAGLTERGVEVT